MHDGLTGTDLEAAVADAFTRVGAEVTAGPAGLHDLVLTFPRPFERPGPRGSLVRFQSRASFIVEVKSGARKTAQLEDVRQLLDWIERETVRRTSWDERDRKLGRLRGAQLEAREEFQRLRHLLATGAIAGSDGELSREHVRLCDRIDQATTELVDALTSRPKGILVMNHQTALPVVERDRPFSEHTVSFAMERGIGLLAWPDLLRLVAEVEAGVTDPLDFFCDAYDSCGVLDWADYRTEAHCVSFMSVHFGTDRGTVLPEVRPAFVSGGR
jgi:hypothetical protein